MSIWGRVFAAVYDTTLRGAEENGLGDLRTELLRDARGRVLEIGAGTGVNLAHYPADGPDALVLTEPEPPMARRLEDRAAGAHRNVEVLRASADALPFEDGCFDVVVATLVLCTVPSVERTLAELRRVLVPGGTLLFLEHVVNPDPARARWQRRVNPVWTRVACGCTLDRDTPALIAAAGFDVRAVRSEHFPKSSPLVQPLAMGMATA